MMTAKYQLNLGRILLISLLITTLAGCSKSDRIPDDPADTITLNMLNEQHGKTFLGKTDVYINKSDNFVMSFNYMADAGDVSGLGVEIAPLLSNLSQEAAVIPGHAYQIFSRTVLFDFPSGKRALQQGAPYLQSYVVSPIITENVITGAMVKFFQTSSYEEALPEFNHKLGIFYNQGEQLEMPLPSGCECVLGDKPYENVNDLFTLKLANGKLSLTLNQSPSEIHGPYGTYLILIRLGSIYTAVKVGVLLY